MVFKKAHGTCESFNGAACLFDINVTMSRDTICNIFLQVGLGLVLVALKLTHSKERQSIGRF